MTVVKIEMRVGADHHMAIVRQFQANGALLAGGSDLIGLMPVQKLNFFHPQAESEAGGETMPGELAPIMMSDQAHHHANPDDGYDQSRSSFFSLSLHIALLLALERLKSNYQLKVSVAGSKNDFIVIILRS